MPKSKLKGIVAIILFFFIDIFIAFSLTSLLGVSNIIIFKSYSAIYNNITWETILFMLLFLIEAFIYEYF